MDWDNLYSGLKDFASVAADKINQTADLAALQVKLSMAEKNLENKFAALGKISYEHFTSDDDLSGQVASAVSDVNKAKLLVLRRRAQLNEAKAAAKAPADVDVRTTVQTKKKTPANAPVHNAAPQAQTTPAAVTEQPFREAPITAQSNAEDTVEILVEETE